MVKRQLELSLGRTPGQEKILSPASIPFKTENRRQSRAHWWFARMRQVVDAGRTPYHDLTR